MTLPDIATSTDLESYQGGDAEAIVRQAQATVRAYCGWHVAPALDETLTLDGQGGYHLWLPTLKINSITSVTNEGADVDTIDGLDWSESGYLERRSGCWSSRPRQIVVTLNHGFTGPPPDLVEVIVSIAARASSSPSGAVREQAGQVSMQWATVAAGVSGGVALMQHERTILDKYKLPPRV